MNSVLIIDDDKELCTLMKKCVEQENLSAVVAHGGLEGLRLLEENKDTCYLCFKPRIGRAIAERKAHAGLHGPYIRSNLS